MSSNAQSKASSGISQPDLVDLQRRHAAQEEGHRERPAVDLVRDHLARQAQALAQQRLR